MKKGILWILIGLALLSVAGCGGNRNVRVEATSTGSLTQCIELASGITDHMARGVADIEYRLDLAKGKYCQAFQNEKGIFYLGPPANLVEYGNSGHKLIFTGGFFVPRESDKLVQWWKLVESTQVIDKQGKTVGLTEFDRLMGFPKPGMVLSQAFSPVNSNALRQLHASARSNKWVKLFACGSLGRSTLHACSRMPSALLRDQSLHVERPLPMALALPNCKWNKKNVIFV